MASNPNMKIIKNVWDKAVVILQKIPLTQQLIITGVVVGTASGLSAYILDILIHWINQLGETLTAGHSENLQMILTIGFPAIGGLICGIILHFFSPESEGHGVPEVVEAIEEQGGYIQGKVVWAKTIASAATIGTGGSAGKEGPIIQIGAAVGSWVGRIFKVSKRDLKTLAAAGAVGGLSAAFNIPLSGVFFTMEVILKDFANEAFPAVVISSVLGAVVSRSLLGNREFFAGVTLHWNSASDLLWYAVLGIFCAPLGLFYTRFLNKVENIFLQETRIPNWVKPAIGGLMVGWIGLYLPRLLGPGEDTIHQALLGKIVGFSVILLAVGKIVVTSLTLGSGGSGGALIPVFFIGIMTGSVWGNFLSHTLRLVEQPSGYAAAGMAAVFTSAFKAPITGILMAFEMTHDEGAILPVMLACILSYLFSHHSSNPQVEIES